MRVLIVHPGIYVYGGAESVIVKLTAYLAEKGIENTLLTTSIVPEMQKDLIKTDIIIQKKLNTVPFNSLRELIALRRGIRNNIKNFDVINVHNFPAELSIFPYRKAVVWMCNEPPEISLRVEQERSLLKKFIIKIILLFDKFVVRRYIKKAVVADQFNAERFWRIYGIKPEIISYGIDHQYFSNGSQGKGLKLDGFSNNFVLLQVGMLTALKNQIESVKTIKELKAKIPSIKLILAGWGESNYKNLLQGYIKDNNLEDAVMITGHLNRESIRDLYYTCDVLLHPVKSQGGWLAPFEALCAKKPIIVSSEMTAASIIMRENIGIVSERFSEAVLEVYNNPQKYDKMAVKGEKWVRENLIWERFCEKMLKLFFTAKNK